MTDDYQRRSYGEIPVGTGEKPGIVVVDFQLGSPICNIRWAARRWSCALLRTLRNYSRSRAATACPWRSATPPI